MRRGRGQGWARFGCQPWSHISRQRRMSSCVSSRHRISIAQFERGLSLSPLTLTITQSEGEMPRGTSVVTVQEQVAVCAQSIYPRLSIRCHCPPRVSRIPKRVHPSIRPQYPPAVSARRTSDLQCACGVRHVTTSKREWRGGARMETARAPIPWPRVNILPSIFEGEEGEGRERADGGQVDPWPAWGHVDA